MIWRGKKSPKLDIDIFVNIYDSIIYFLGFTYDNIIGNFIDGLCLLFNFNSVTMHSACNQ